MHESRPNHLHADVLAELQWAEHSFEGPALTHLLRRASRIIAGITGGAGYPAVTWKTFNPSRDLVPPAADTYLVANDTLNRTALARWRPRLGKWTFANAAQAFLVTHYSPGPLAPHPLPGQHT